MRYEKLVNSVLHFGNTEGIDRLKGKNGIVMGTPHLDETCYKLVGCYLGLGVEGKDAEMHRRKVCANGFEFYMMTYEMEALRTIQLYRIESELEQCIGRSRLLREDCKVYLLSNYPCSQAELRQEDYLD